MKPLIHAKLTVKSYGGHVDDYLLIHNFIDHSKSSVPDVRHRAMLHSSWGIYLVEQMFGAYITNSEDKQISTRDIAEEHIIQDLGFIPTMEKWLNTMPIEGWMSGTKKKNSTKSMKFTTPAELSILD